MWSIEKDIIEHFGDAEEWNLGNFNPIDMNLLGIVEDGSVETEGNLPDFSKNSNDCDHIRYIRNCPNARFELYIDQNNNGRYKVENNDGVFIDFFVYEKGKIASPEVGIYFVIKSVINESGLWHYYDPEQIEYAKEKGLDIKTLTEADLNNIGLFPSEQIETIKFPSIGQVISIATERISLEELNEEYKKSKESKSAAENLKEKEMELAKVNWELAQAKTAIDYALSETTLATRQGDKKGREEFYEFYRDKIQKLNKRKAELIKLVEFYKESAYYEEKRENAENEMGEDQQKMTM